MSSITKSALKDPAGWTRRAVENLPGDIAAQDLIERADALKPLVDSLRRLQAERGTTSRAIGEAKARAGDVTSLLERMREIGAETSTRESALRAELGSIVDAIEGHRADGGASSAAERSVQGGRDRTVPGYFDRSAACRASPSDIASAALSIHTDFTDEEYAGYVRSHPARTSYHDIGLRALIVDTLGQPCHYLLARADDGTVRGVLPIVRLKSRPIGHFMVSMPWFNYGGPLADDEETAAALMRKAAETAREHGCSHAEIRETRPRDGWTVVSRKVSMTLDLPDSVDELEHDLGASLRAQSNKATRAGCLFRTGRQELLDDFYRVFSINMRDLGTPVHGRAFFDGLLGLFGNDAFIAVVSRNGEPLAASFLLAHGDTLEVPWASSLRRANPLGVNMLLYRRTLGEAIERGYRHFDFGRSTSGGPTWRFKKQWGAVPHRLYWHYWTADGVDTPGLSPDSPRFRLAIAAWQRMPVTLTRRLGPSIVRGLP